MRPPGRAKPPAGPVRVPPAAAAGSGIGRLIRLILIALLGGLGVLLGASALGLFLLLRDVSPPVCAARAIPTGAAASQQLRANWRTFGEQAARGPASIQLTEEQATSRGVEYIREKDAPVEALYVRFCAGGFGEASGKVSILGRHVNTVVRGTLDLSGPKPRIKITSVRAGSLPDAMARPIVNRILDAGDLRTLNLDEHLTGIRFDEGTAAIEGGP